MAKRDYYEVLGVSRDASVDVIKKSYRQIALQCHPDRNPGDAQAEERFKEASEAYQILSNAETRARYDRFGHGAFSSGGGFEGFGDFSTFADEIFGDLFSAFFGGTSSRSSSRQRAGRDLSYRLEITLEEAATGLEKSINLRKPVPCESCAGSGCRTGTSREKCRHCDGRGQVTVQQGFFSIARGCSVCNGEGTIISDPCPSCGGGGRTNKEVDLLVKIPAGIDSGQRLKLRGEGEVIPDGNPGDLYVEISIAPHKIFQRQDTEIICEIPISYSQATLGGEAEVPTLYGNVTMKIPPGTPSGKIFRLRGKGMVNMHTGKNGDQHVRAYVYVPQSVTDRQRELLEELSKIEGKPIANDSRSIFEKFKDLFE